MGPTPPLGSGLPPNMMRAGIYMGWVGRDNLGDEAMYEFCKMRFPSVRWSSFYDVAYKPNLVHALTRGVRDSSRLFRSLVDELQQQRHLRALVSKVTHRLSAQLNGEVGLLGGGTLINQAEWNLQSYIDVRNRTRSLVPVFGTGVAAPEFWSSKAGWKDHCKDWVAVLAELPEVGVRGPHSAELLKDAGATNVVVCGDPAISYHARYQNQPSFDPIERPLRIAINTGDCSGNLWGTQEDIQLSLLGLTQWLLKEGNHHIEFIPVWDKDVSHCTDIARRAGMAESTVSPALTSHASFLSKVETFDLIIALKLHAAVLSAAANVPCILLEYQPKCRDFAASLDWEQFTIRTDQLNPPKLIDRVAGLIEQLPSAKRQLYGNVRKLSQRFDQYCRTIEPLLIGKRPALPHSKGT